MNAVHRLVLAALAMLGAACLVGCDFFFGGYSRTVGRPPAEVAAELARVDMGAGLHDDSEYRLEMTPGRISWYVMSGESVAARLTADLEPLDGGTRTRVTAKVEHGDVPQDRVPPALRSTAGAFALFTRSLDIQLDSPGAERQANAQSCEELMQEFHDRAIDERTEPSASLDRSMDRTAGGIVKLGRMEHQMRRAGCHMGFDGPFRTTKNTMQPTIDRMHANPNTGKPYVEPGSGFREAEEKAKNREYKRFGDPMSTPGEM